jgi:hypothetical protein
VLIVIRLIHTFYAKDTLENDVYHLWYGMDKGLLACRTPKARSIFENVVLEAQSTYSKSLHPLHALIPTSSKLESRS